MSRQQGWRQRLIRWKWAALFVMGVVQVATAEQPTLSHLGWPISGEVRAYFKRPAQDTLVAIADRWQQDSGYDPMPSLQRRVKAFPDDATLVAAEEAMSYLLTRQYTRWGWTPVVFPPGHARAYQLNQANREWVYPVAPPVGSAEAIVKLGVPAVGPDGQPLAACRLLNHSRSAIFEVPQSDVEALARITGHMACLKDQEAADYWKTRTFPEKPYGL